MKPRIKWNRRTLIALMTAEIGISMGGGSVRLVVPRGSTSLPLSGVLEVISLVPCPDAEVAGEDSLVLGCMNADCTVDLRTAHQEERT